MTVYTFGLRLETIQYIFIIGMLIPIFLIDYEYYIIPDGLNMGIFLVAVFVVLIQIVTVEK